MDVSKEFQQLFEKNLEGRLEAAEQGRLEELLRLPEVSEKAAEWLAGLAAAEPASSLGQEAWQHLDTKTLKAYQGWQHTWLRGARGFVLGSLCLGAAALGLWAWLGGSLASNLNDDRFIDVESSKVDIHGIAPVPKATKPAGQAQAERLGPPPIGPIHFSSIEWCKNGLEIKVDKEQSGPVEIAISNAQGQVLRQLYQGELKAGHWSFEWNGRLKGKHLAPAGKYYVEIKAAGTTQKQMVELEYRPKD